MLFLKENRNVILFLGVLVFLVYFNALGNNFVSDDLATISSPLIAKIEYFWHPPYFNMNIRAVYFFFISQLFGFVPFLFRLPNILAHFGSAILIFMILRKLSNQAVAIFSATIFAVHPIFIEGVTWISGGGYSLSTFFVLASFLFYLNIKNGKSLLFFIWHFCLRKKPLFFR